MEQLEELEHTFVELYQSALLLQQGGKQKAAVILFSKALFALIDYIIFEKYQKLPKNHGERFRILELKFPSLYEIVNSVWGKYTDTYHKPALEESVSLLKQSIKEVVDNAKITRREIKIIIE